MFEQLFAKIESPLFYARLSVLSGFDSFVRELESSLEVQSLLAEMKSAEAKSAVLHQLIEAANRETDGDFANPWDIALAAYLWILQEVDEESATFAAILVAQTLNCWWAKKLAQKIQKSPQSCSDAASVHAP